MCVMLNLVILASKGWMDGWMSCDLRPFQKYYSHIRMMDV